MSKNINKISQIRSFNYLQLLLEFRTHLYSIHVFILLLCFEFNRPIIVNLKRYKCLFIYFLNIFFAFLEYFAPIESDA